MRNSRTRCTLLLLGLAAVMLPITASTAEAQYFGRNKVQYEQFDFQVLKTEHFDVYYYPEERDAAVLAGRMAERWYSRLSRLLNHELGSRQPLIMYANHPHFEQTNALQGELGEATGGVTEVFKRRIVLPFAGGLAETDHVIGHELVHAFQFDITGEGRSVQTGGIPGALRLPLWFIEGMAEYLSVGPVDPQTAMWLRDAIDKELPTIRQMGDAYKWFPYRWGQAFWSYVAGRYGDEIVGRLLKAAGRTTTDPEGALARLLGGTTAEISEQWHQSIRALYEPLRDATTPTGEYGIEVFASGSAGNTSVAPAISPDGRYLAFISARDLFSLDIFIGDLEHGGVIRKLTRTAVDPHFESLQFISSAGAWSPDARQFALAGISQGKPILSLIDVESGDISRDIRLPELGEIYTPSWAPGGRFIVFSAIRGGLSDLFLYDLEDGLLRRVTNDAYGDLHPVFSPDGRRIAFVTDRFETDVATLRYGPYQLAILDPSTGAIERVAAFDGANHTNPQWSADGESLYFVSDRTGIANLYRVELATGALRQVTNLFTGIAGITPLSPAFSAATRSDQAVFSVYQDGDYRLHKVESLSALERDVHPTFAQADPARLPPTERITDDLVTALDDASTGLADSLEFETRPYGAGLALDYVAQPSLLVGSDRFGTFIGGGAALYWSDMLGNRNLATALQFNGSFKDILALVGYTNLSRRWNWGAFVQQVPLTSRFVTGGIGTVNGEPAEIIQTDLFRQTSRDLSGLLAYPFNRVRRIEFSAGVQDIRFERERRTQAFSLLSGNEILDSTQSFATFSSLQLATGSAALVYDNALLGATSPILGQRYRLELSPVVGGLNYLGVLADYRRYVVPVRPFTLGARLFHFGRYSGDSEDARIRPLYLGWPGLVRGYDDGSFEPQDCLATADDPCPLFSRLLGSKVAVANVELRFPLLGALGVGSGYYGFLPIELALFTDAGLAWCEGDASVACSATQTGTNLDERAFFLGGDRKPVVSSGVALRMNFFGFAIVEMDYAYAFQRDRWIWQFGFTPGF